MQPFVKLIKFKTIRPCACSCLLQPVIWSDGCSSLWRRCQPFSCFVLSCSRASCHTQGSLVTGTGSIQTQAGSRDSCTGLPPGYTGHRCQCRTHSCNILRSSPCHPGTACQVSCSLVSQQRLAGDTQTPPHVACWLPLVPVARHSCGVSVTLELL